MNTDIRQQIIDSLNEFLQLDEPAIRAVIGHRVPCNGAMANHPTIQVNANHEVGMLGLLNGIAGCDGRGHGWIAMVVEDDGTIVRFEMNRGGIE